MLQQLGMFVGHLGTYNSAGNDFCDGAAVAFEQVWLSLVLYWIVLLGFPPFTFIFGV